MNDSPFDSTTDSTTDPAAESETDSTQDAAGDTASPSDRRADPSASQLEAEGDIAADYIEELLDICDLDGDIDIDARNGRSYVSVSGGDGSNISVLSRPETVNALQELTRLVVQTKTGDLSRLILDIGGSRDIRREELASLVSAASDRIEAGSSEAGLPPMSSYERKLVHDLVAEKGLTSQSRGEGRERHTVITRGA